MTNHDAALETDLSVAASFRLADVFPNVERILRQETSADGEFMHHDELVARLLEDAACQDLIASASQANGKSTGWNASNMLAWFSHWYTRREKVDPGSFERRKLGGRWAYRSTASIAQVKADGEAA